MSSPSSPCQRPPLFLLFIKQYFFVISLFVAAGVGLLLPKAAMLLSDYRSPLLFFVMFLVGLEQTIPEIAAQFRKVGAIFLSLVLSFGLFPLYAWVIGRAFFDGGAVLAGFVVLGAVPTTLTSAVIYTRLDKGNDRLALVIVLLSQLLAVVLTPALIALFLQRSAAVDTIQMIQNLCLYFLLPMALGMGVAKWFPVAKIRPYLTRPEQLVVALFVFMGAGHIPRDTGWGLIGQSFLAVIIIQMGYVVVVRWVIRRFTPSDQTALFFTTTQKTLSVGLYLLLSYFPSAAILPMVLYHLMQLTIGRLYWRPPQKL